MVRQEVWTCSRTSHQRAPLVAVLSSSTHAAPTDCSLAVDRHVLIAGGQDDVALPVQARQLAHQHAAVTDADLGRSKGEGLGER